GIRIAVGLAVAVALAALASRAVGINAFVAAAVGVMPIRSFGWPFLVLAIVGLAVNLRSGRFDDWWLLVWGWLLATSVLRSYFAAMPAVAIFAATGIVALWNAGGQRRALAVVSSALGAATGIIGWLGVLGPALD